MLPIRLTPPGAVFDTPFEELSHARRPMVVGRGEMASACLATATDSLHRAGNLIRYSKLFQILKKLFNFRGGEFFAEPVPLVSVTVSRRVID